MTFRLGIIGMSEGNGHPYSWAAIFNGYDRSAMELSGFPAITAYLDKRPWPRSRIDGASVTCVWTQDRQLSERIAKASLIPRVLDNLGDMIGAVDGVLLARDDAENHLCLAGPFLDAGLPVYVDKPVALRLEDMERLYARERFAGQIFSCSALRYSNELVLTDEELADIGEIHEIHATTPKSWDKYAVHIIEPVLKLVGNQRQVVETQARRIGADGVALTVHWSGGLATTLSAMGKGTHAPIALRVFGEKGWKDLLFSDSFSCFKLALQDFVEGARERSERAPRAFNRRVVSLIEAGREVEWKRC